MKHFYVFTILQGRFSIFNFQFYICGIMQEHQYFSYQYSPILSTDTGIHTSGTAVQRKISFYIIPNLQGDGNNSPLTHNAVTKHCTGWLTNQKIRQQVTTCRLDFCLAWKQGHDLPTAFLIGQKTSSILPYSTAGQKERFLTSLLLGKLKRNLPLIAVPILIG